MRVSIVITPDGRPSAITRDGTFAEGKARLLELAAGLRTEGIEIPLPSDSGFEQRRHDREPVASRERAGRAG